MSRFEKESQLPDGLEPLAQRLREERPLPTAEELDRAKLHAMTQASRAGSARRTPRVGLVRSRRVVSIALAIGLMTGGTAVIAKSGGPKAASSKSNGSSANSQYCPPSSQQPGKPKKPGPAKCGKPKTK
jgi:hypothetical protein